jgi:hypothetical protein
MDNFNPSSIEDRFKKNSYIKQAYLLPQRVLIVVLSEATQSLEKKNIEKSLKKTLSSANNQFTAAEKVSHIYIVQELLAPEDRTNIDAKYGDAVNQLIKSPSPIIWE